MVSPLISKHDTFWVHYNIVARYCQAVCSLPALECFEGCSPPPPSCMLLYSSDKPERTNFPHETKTSLRPAGRPYPDLRHRQGGPQPGGARPGGRHRSESGRQLPAERRDLCSPPGTAGCLRRLERLVGQQPKGGCRRLRQPVRHRKPVPKYRDGQRPYIQRQGLCGAWPDLHPPADSGHRPGRQRGLGSPAGRRGGDLSRRGSQRHGPLLAQPHHQRRESGREHDRPDRRGQCGAEPGCGEGVPQHHSRRDRS